ncbi:MAG: DUF3429 domain-containing protein [Hyphomicrobiales bacterium]|nr:DUF3429 domain-containing protein [Hyphomicrobiales bacterium]
MQSNPEKSEAAGGKRIVWLLSLIMLAPLVIVAVMLASIDNGNPAFPPLLDGFKTTSAIILSFLGGIRWGSEMRNHAPNSLILVAAMVPPLIGWTSLLLTGPTAIGLLLIAVCAMGAWDSFYWHDKTDTRWYAAVRTIMTLAAAFLHGLVLSAMF